MQAGRSRPLSTDQSVSPEPVPRPLTASKNPTEPLLPKRKSEEEGWSKRRRRDSGSVVESVQKLSKENLEEHNRQTESKTSMGGGKRTLSRRTNTPDMSKDVGSISSQKSSTCAIFRGHSRFCQGRCREWTCAKENIPKCFDGIIEPTFFKQNERALSNISNTFYNKFVNIRNGASREDDSTEPIHDAFTLLDSNEDFLLLKKSGISRPTHLSVFA